MFEAETNLPVSICGHAMRPVCHRSPIPLWCLPNQRCLLLQTPRAHWSAWCSCSPLEYPSGSSSQEPWPHSLYADKIWLCMKTCHHPINVWHSPTASISNNSKTQFLLCNNANVDYIYDSKTDSALEDHNGMQIICSRH